MCGRNFIKIGISPSSFRGSHVVATATLPGGSDIASA